MEGAAALPEPGLGPEEREAFARGVALFNERRFFECHDVLEELWSGLRGPSRDFFQGLIQVAVAFYHLESGNLAGAESLLQRALQRFARYPGCYFGLDLDAHRRELLGWLARIRAGDVAGELPRWRFDALS